jgi:uncharacterized protein (TIGR02996 family)
MSDEQALLAAIRAHPDDDAPRLIYADWLEERGDARGEFLRAECLLARHSPRHGEYPRLKARLRAIGLRLEVGWLALVSRAPVWLEPECFFFASQGWVQIGIRWRDERLFHYTGGSVDEGGLKERFPSAAEWASFWSALEGLDCWEWSGDYGRRITCGIPWTLELVYRGRALRCAGNGFSGDAAPPRFGRFYQAMCRLIDVSDFLPGAEEA